MGKEEDKGDGRGRKRKEKNEREGGSIKGNEGMDEEGKLVEKGRG